MEEREISKKKYEMAYLLSPNVSEEEVVGYDQKIASFISKLDGEINEARPSKKIKLAYPIKKNFHAYFGLVNFSAFPEKIGEIEKNLKFEEKLLRYLIVFLDKKAEAAKKGGAPTLPAARQAFAGERKVPSPVRSGAKYMIPELKTAARPAAPAGRQAAPAEMKPEEKKASLEEIEKKLEKILGE